MKTLIERFLFEKDLEYSFNSFFKKDSTFGLEHCSSITNCNVCYTGSQLMSLYAITAEIEANSIIKMKYGARTKHIGGTDVSDVIIQGSPYAFNIKTLNENSGMIKLCTTNAPNKLHGLEYRFIVLTYKLNETLDKVVFDRTYVFDFEYIKEILTSRDGSYYMSKGKMLEYVLRRDKFVNGDTSTFKRLTAENLKVYKPEIKRDPVLNYLKKKRTCTIEDLNKRFKSEYDLNNLSIILITLEDEGVITIKDSNLVFNMLDVIESAKLLNEKLILNKIESKINNTRKAFDLYNSSQLAGVNNLTDFRTYLRINLNMSNKLASHYTMKVIKEKGFNIHEYKNAGIGNTYSSS